ncbi:putative RNA-binding protein containing a PIN domain [Synechococcus sp. PCC 7502]|uniref:NYN domain-containing protein n=1 Tax=Synechococcus sp. PCC 7502 TaxID=1173263 RepID=UPI00029FE097|nr:NYN domain-containing protein [Synechococcus sp. PCC 7502]AFY74929.1 putative RNA-binding protein containing a PIN domain [Synechococcus sp. PCC 7502]
MAHPPVMLVDAYNIIGAWASLKRWRDLGDFDAARTELTEIMAGYSSYHGYQSTLVFDAYNVPTPAVTEKVTKNLKLHFTNHRQTADSYIEKCCAEVHRHPLRHLKRVIVVTSDRAQHLTTTGFGAEWMSALALEQEVELTFKSVRHRQKPQTQSVKRLLSSTLDDQTRERLNKLRQDLT